MAGDANRHWSSQSGSAAYNVGRLGADDSNSHVISRDLSPIWAVIGSSDVRALWRRSNWPNLLPQPPVRRSRMAAPAERAWLPSQSPVARTIGRYLSPQPLAPAPVNERSSVRLHLSASHIPLPCPSPSTHPCFLPLPWIVRKPKPSSMRCRRYGRECTRISPNLKRQAAFFSGYSSASS